MKVSNRRRFSIEEVITFDLDRHLKQTEIQFLDQYLTAVGGNKSAAARLLGMNRSTLVMRLKALKLDHWLQKTKADKRSCN